MESRGYTVDLSRSLRIITLMNTHNVMDMIEVYDLPLDSSLGAVQIYNERARAGKYDYGAVLRSLVGINC